MIEPQLKSTIKMRKQGFRYKKLFFIIVTSVLSLSSTLQRFIKKKKKRFKILIKIGDKVAIKELFFIIVTSVLSLVSFIAIFLSKIKKKKKKRFEIRLKIISRLKSVTKSAQTKISLFILTGEG